MPNWRDEIENSKDFAELRQLRRHLRARRAPLKCISNSRDRHDRNWFFHGVPAIDVGQDKTIYIDGFVRRVALDTFDNWLAALRSQGPPNC